MRVLLLQPEDFLHSGPWSAQTWDLVVNFGRSGPSPLYKTPNSSRVLHLDSYSQGMPDVRLVRALLHAGRGQLIGGHEIDWWDLISVAIIQQVFTVLQLQRLAAEILAPADCWSTRPDWTTRVLGDLLHTSVRSFRSAEWARAKSAVSHYSQVLRHFSSAQIKQILFDKYDASYRWRSHFSAKQTPCSERVVLVPSAYSNVSRMAALYAAMLPHLRFLFVATRQSAHEFSRPENVEVRNLGSYAQAQPEKSELVSIIEGWTKLKSYLQSWEPLRLLSSAGILDQVPELLHSAPFVRDAWRQVLQSEPVCSVFCGDDSNFITRLPVLLAAKRDIPTVDFHHGALDGLYLVKELPSDLFLAKGEMERDYLVRICGLPAEKVVIAPPTPPPTGSFSSSATRERNCIILFSEPYEQGGIHAEDVYGELLAPLWLLAREHGRGLVIKLHPFESRTQRMRVARGVLPADAARHVRWIQGPLTSELLGRAWFGVTVESSTAVDCTRNGVCCFLCRWLTLSPYGYAEQYARFGVGESLQAPEQISEIPGRVEQFYERAHASPQPSIDPPHLLQWLTSGCYDAASARSAS